MSNASALARETYERDDMDEVLTVDELAAFLRLERKTVYAAIQRGEIPGVRRIGKCIRISRGAVLEWLKAEDLVLRTSRRR